MKLAALARPKIRDRVAQQIKEFIATERLHSGDRLPNEGELAQKFGVSRLSVREATKALEFLGIVESKTGVGLAVGRLDMARMTDHLGFHPALFDADPLQLIDSRIVLETGVLPHVIAGMQRDPQFGERLSAIVADFRTARGIGAWIELDIHFHRTLLEASGLAPLVAFGDLLQVFFQRFRDSVKRAEWKDSIASHERIVERLRAADLAGATHELRRHIESHKQRLGAMR